MKNFDWHHQTFDMEQDSLGLLYFANVSGVKSFDGTTWRTLYRDIVSTSLEINSRNQQLFVGGVGDFGYISRATGSWGEWVSLLPQLQKHHQQFNTIWSISTTSKGVLFQADHFLFLWMGSTLS